MFRCARLILLAAGSLALKLPVHAVPISPDRQPEAVADRAGFIPNRKHLPLPGKVIAVLIADAQPILSLEGRAGPADQLCIGYGGASYRWVYLSVNEKPTIRNLSLPLPEGKTKVYPSLSMASPALVKPLGIEAPYALVEIEVNDGAGSPASDAFVATKMTKLDGGKEYPLQVAEVIAEARKRYEAYLSDQRGKIDIAMVEAAKKSIKERQPTGPREQSTLMFVTWMPDTEKLVVRFRTRISDGVFKYANGINIELAAPPQAEGPPQGGPAPPARRPSGLRYGTQFGIELGGQFEVSKIGKVDRFKTLEIESFTSEIPPPPKARQVKE